MKRRVFHQHNKYGQGDMTYKKAKQKTRTHISTFVHLWD